MSLLHALALLPGLLAAVGTARLLMLKVGAPSGEGRFVVLDGLRGYLAFFVFLHHAAVWHVFLRTGAWKAPEGNLYNQLGQLGVALFFMITGFLFFGKLLDGRTKGVDWLRLYVSRVLRLLPLYLLALAAVVAVTFVLSGGRLLQEPLALAKALVCWASFTVLGSPDLNGVEGSIRIMAGVTWSLPYEWFFYLVLPMMALTLRIRTPLYALGLAGAGLYWLLFRCPEIFLACMFLGGMVAAGLVRLPRFGVVARSVPATCLLLALPILLVAFWPSVDGVAPLLLLSVVFAILAGGNDLFGLLSLPVSRLLGEISYSLYLLHGIVLFVLFGVVLEPGWSRSLTWWEHWGLVGAATPLLVLLCYLTYRLVELPAMRATPGLVARLRSLASRAGIPR